MLGYYNYTVWLTYLSLISSSTGIYFALNGHPFFAIICLLFSGFCDMFDGKVARTKDRDEKEANYGIQIDSLSDLVCFGVLPVVIGYSIGMNEWFYVPIMALFILFGMIRLAYFNVNELFKIEQQPVKKVFHGLPITSSSLIFPLIYCFKKIIGKYFYIVYASVMGLVAILFVTKIKIRKPGNKAILGMTIMGALILIFLIVGRYIKCR